MNSQNKYKSFRLTPEIIPLVIVINLLSLNFLISLTAQAAFSQSTLLISLTNSNNFSDHLKHHSEQNTRLFAQNGLIQVPEDRRFINQNFSKQPEINIIENYSAFQVSKAHRQIPDFLKKSGILFRDCNATSNHSMCIVAGKAIAI